MADKPLTQEDFNNQYYRDGFNRVIRKDGTPLSANEQAVVEARLVDDAKPAEPITTAPRGAQDFGNTTYNTRPSDERAAIEARNHPEPITHGVINTTQSMKPSGAPAKTDEDGGPVDPKKDARP